MTTRFRHFRIWDEESPGFNHVRPKGGVTLAIYSSEGETLWAQVGVSICSPSDNFCKKTGRDLAFDRCQKGAYIAVLPKPMLTDIVLYAIATNAFNEFHERKGLELV
jgi:hypothetical protein